MNDDKTRAEFEKEFPLPDDCEWNGIDAYCWPHTRAPHPHDKHWEGWQAAKERYGRDEDAALDLLCVMFDGYENGVDCYEDPEDQSGYVGSAFRLNDEDFHKIADLLNRRRPVSQPATKEQKHEQ